LKKITYKIQKNDLKEKEKEHFASIFTFQNIYEEKWPKMTRNTLKSPKNDPQMKNI
jgi:hypothetical protein